MLKKITWISYCAFLGLVAASSIILESNSNTDAYDPSQHSSGNRFEHAVINAYNNKANLVYSLSSPEIDYQQDRGFTFGQPEFVYKNSEATPFILYAEKGYMENHFAPIELRGNVQLSRHNPQNNTLEYLYTTTATVDAEQKKAYTSDKVVFKQHNKTTEGVGMIIDLDAQTVELKSNIKVLNVF